MVKQDIWLSNIDGKSKTCTIRRSRQIILAWKPSKAKAWNFPKMLEDENPFVQETEVVKTAD